ncbi:copper resistance protein B [Fodinibius halophilus]|uniref:Copper resistance protein B n=1 Tax=Fodinibius halophilus TaxID=1736908 RepID=A0A6M1TNX3_9BACT|nr:copper resistance protein B [Fodinibius halophilus]NGP90030.1 copper resistance protein B [Fodinibius halophilus]
MRQLSIFLSAVFLMILFVSSNTAVAQKAPEFSNDLLMDNKTYTYIIADKLEYQSLPGPNPIMWELQGYIGKDLHKFWFKSDGEALTTQNETELEFQGLYSRAISRYFDLQVGIRYDLIYEGSDNLSRGFGVIGFQGMAPYFFEVDGGLFISEDGDISASFEAEYDLPITQRLIGQPLIETSLAFQDVPEYGIRSGINDIELGFRLRYEIEREFAPYIGVNWERKLGKTADMYADPSTLSLLGGVRMWF